MVAPTACRRMVSGALSLPCSGCFSPFPHGTGPLSVSREYLALPDGPGRFTQNSSCSALLRIPLRFASLRVRGSHALRLPFPEHSPHDVSSDIAVLLPRRRLDADGLGSSPFARHYWGNHCYFLFLRVLRCFSSPRSPPQNKRIAPSRGLSQLITSFVASESQGIHPAPFPTFFSPHPASLPEIGVYFQLYFFPSERFLISYFT